MPCPDIVVVKTRKLHNGGTEGEQKVIPLRALRTQHLSRTSNLATDNQHNTLSGHSPRLFSRCSNPPGEDDPVILIAST